MTNGQKVPQKRIVQKKKNIKKQPSIPTKCTFSNPVYKTIKIHYKNLISRQESPIYHEHNTFTLIHQIRGMT